MNCCEPWIKSTLAVLVLKSLPNLHGWKRRNSPFVSQNALSAIIGDIKKNGIPDCHSRSSVGRATALSLERHDVYGPLLQEHHLVTTEGGACTVLFTNLFSYMAALYGTASYRELLQRTASQQPSSFDNPWGLIVYSDEIVPGNPLGRAERKLWSIYACFTEMSLEDQSNELAWLPLCCIRSSKVQLLEGGMRQLMAALLKSIFCNTKVSPAFGVLLPGGSDCPAFKVYFKLKTILQDGASHRMTWGSKGEAALKYCVLCDIRTPPAALRADDDDAGVAHFLKYSDMKVFTSQEILSSYDRLAAKKAELGKADFAKWEKAVGLSYSPRLMCLDAELMAANILHPKEQFTHDWMHTCVSNGIFQKVVYKLFCTMGNKSWKLFEQYLQCWTVPKKFNMNHLASSLSAKKVSTYCKNGNCF